MVLSSVLVKGENEKNEFIYNFPVYVKKKY